MSTLGEVRRAVKAAKAAEERRQAAIKAAMEDPGVSWQQVAAETGLSKQRLYQIKAGVRAQSKDSGEKVSS